MAKRYFEFTEGTSNKFWEVWKEGTQVFTRYGKIGTEGSTTVKDEGSAEKAQKLHDKLVKEKTGKGYEEQTAEGADADDDEADSHGAADFVDGEDEDEDEDEEDEEADDAPAASGAPGVRYFEFVEGSSAKFWEIRKDGTEVFTRYGKIGASGAQTVKDEGSDDKAQKLYDKLIKEKTGKGYEEKTAGGAAPAPAAKKKVATLAVADDDDDGDDDDDDDGDDDAASGTAAGTRRFEFTEDGAGKFWEISVSGSSHTVKYGKIGSDGQSKTKDFGSAALAQKDVDKLIAEKTKKGYEEV